MRKVSVIVPVFNAAEYLAECVTSILGQQNIECELLLVESGSTDGSKKICESIAAEHENVLILNLKSKGPGDARNTGLEAATGEYIAFVDADDYLPDAKALHRMVNSLEENGADIAVGNYQRLWNGRMLSAAGHNSFSRLNRESAEFRFRGFFSGGVLSYVWCKLYRKSFLRKHRIRFGDYNYAEDKMFNFVCYLHGASYAFLDENVYVYRRNVQSISNVYRKGSIECWMRLAGELQDLLEQNGKDKLYGDLTANTIFFAVFFDAKMIYLHSGKKLGAVRQVLKKYRGFPLAKKAFSDFAGGKELRKIPSLLWKTMIFGFSAALYFKCYLLIAIGIKFLIDWRIDERLSDTGLRGEG